MSDLRIAQNSDIINSKYYQVSKEKNSNVHYDDPIDKVEIKQKPENKKSKGIFKRVKAALAVLVISLNLSACQKPNEKSNNDINAGISASQSTDLDNYDNSNVVTYSAGYDSSPTDVTETTEEKSNLEDHIHAATVITTPHETIRYVYVPQGGTNEGDNYVEAEVKSGDTLKSIVNNYFAKINDDNVYPIALDQAKANSEMILNAINANSENNYEDVADIPKDVLINTSLNNTNETKTIKLVNSSFEDFAQNSDEISMTTFVDQERFISDNEYVVIDPNWNGETSDPSGYPTYNSVEEAILNNYRSTNAEKRH